MSFLPPALQREVERRTAKDQEAAMTADTDEVQRLEARVRTQLDFARQAQVTAEEFGRAAMGSGTHSYLTVALATEHRTILGQISRAVAEAILYTVDMEGFDNGDSIAYCKLARGEAWATTKLHPAHDGRLTCDTVQAAMLAVNQPVI